MDYSLMDSTSFCGGSGKQKDPLSFVANPTTDLHIQPHENCSNGIVTEEMAMQKKMELQKQKKRETDRRYRLKKKEIVAETENKLAVAITENDNLKCTIKKLQQEKIQLTKQLKRIDRRFKKFARLEKEMDDLKQENIQLRKQISSIDLMFKTMYAGNGERTGMQKSPSVH